MRRKSAKPDGTGEFAIAKPVPPRDHFPAQQGVSISLRFYAPSVECFSDWTAQDLKRFSSLVSKLKDLETIQLKENHNLCKAHSAPPKNGTYRRPASISKEIKFYELKASGQLRMHGVFQGPVFHLVWLDRKHNVFRDGG